MLLKKESALTPLFEHYKNLSMHVVQGLVGEDADVAIEVNKRSGKIYVEITVPNQFRGHVIGKGGRIARAIRTLIDVAPFDSPYPTVVTIVD